MPKIKPTYCYFGCFCVIIEPWQEQKHLENLKVPKIALFVVLQILFCTANATVNNAISAKNAIAYLLRTKCLVVVVVLNVRFLFY